MDYRKTIRDPRENHDLTQAQAAAIPGTSQTLYARYERGASELPVRRLITLAKYYRVSADFILGLDQPEEKNTPPRGAE